MPMSGQALAASLCQHGRARVSGGQHTLGGSPEEVVVGWGKGSRAGDPHLQALPLCRLHSEQPC